MFSNNINFIYVLFYNYKIVLPSRIVGLIDVTKTIDIRGIGSYWMVQRQKAVLAQRDKETITLL